uniref:Uncharacterized protein n=2 Tax=Oryza punctata TaxID=4537 RepID=A0A0E0KNM7_ORYPU
MTRLATGRLGTGCCRRGRVIALATGGGTRTVAPGTPAWGPEAWGATPGAARTGGGGDGEAWGGRGGGALPLQEDGCRQSRSCTINRTCRIIIVEAICDPVHELWHLAMAHFSPSISHCRWLVITEAMGSSSKDHRRVPRPPPLSLYIEREQGEVVMAGQPLATTRMLQQVATSSNGKKRILSKQLSMKETTREVKWEKRRRQIHRQRSSLALQDAEEEASANMFTATADSEAGSSTERVPKSLTDGDLDELRGSMELGFGFDEENGGQNLCDTLPALDLYFAVNRQLSEPKMRLSTSSLPSPTSATSSSSTLGGTSNPGSPVAPSSFMDSWKICSPGDNPQLVKTRLRHWAQVVACSVKHSS